MKKAMQLCKLTGCMIEMRIYQPDDHSLVEYMSSQKMSEIQRYTSLVTDYSKFTDKHYDIILSLEQKFSDYRNKSNLMEQFQNLIGPDFHELTEGINMTSVFSLAKTKPIDKTANSKDHENSLNKNTAFTSDAIHVDEEFSPPSKKPKLEFRAEAIKDNCSIQDTHKMDNQDYLVAFSSLKQKIDLVVKNQNQQSKKFDFELPIPENTSISGPIVIKSQSQRSLAF